MSEGSLSITGTGLQGVDTALQAVSDNVANVNTDGFNSETVEFGTILGSYVNGNEIGGGVQALGVARDFSPGAIVQTSDPTNMAVQGNGFFIYQTPAGLQVYSQNGGVNVAADGTLEAANGYKLLGYALSPNGTRAGTLSPIKIPQGLSAPQASTSITLSGNLNASDPVITGTAINPSDPTTYDASVSVTVYDSVGTSHVVTFYFQNAGAGASPGTEQWNWLATLDGSTAGLSNNTGSFTFNTSTGTISSGGVPANPLTATPAGAAPLSLSLNFNALTQFASGDALSGSANGAPAGTPQQIEISNNGVISVSYSNGQKVEVAQVALATFTGTQGLALTQGGMYEATASSGTPTIATPGAGGAGLIEASAVNSSNVSLSAQLVNLVVLQNDYEANAKALQTEASVLASILGIQIPPV